ncbi:MAG: DNA translocase FtsK 4TM domain-containing protein [Phycisphaeraceae bacterium]
MARKRRKKARDRIDNKTLLKYAAWAVLAGVWAMLVAALGSYDPADWPGYAVAPYNADTHNWVGRFGALVSHKIYFMIGPGAWVALAGALAFLIATALGRKVSQLPLRIIGVLMMSLATSAMVGIAWPDLLLGIVPGGDRPEGPGGLIAIYINTELTQRFAAFGTMAILVVGFWIGAVLALDRVVTALPRVLGRWYTAVASRLAWPKPVLVGRLATLPRLWGWGRREGRNSAAKTKRRVPVRGRMVLDDDEWIDEDAGGLGATEPFDPEANKRRGRLDDEDDALDEETEEDDGEAPNADPPGAYAAQKKQFDPDALRAKIKKLPINFAPKRGKTAAPPPREIDLSGYQFPDMDLLVDPQSNFTDEMERIVRDQAVQLESALQQYRIEGEVVGIDSGPVITLYEVRLAPGTKVSQLSAISSDLARALRAHNIRIVPNMAGKDTVGIEVPNLKKEQVRLKELMTARVPAVKKMRLPMFLAKDASGNPLIADLGVMPHMLIAGTTGSGKSVCINAIIMSFLYTRRPDELKLVLVDPKMVEMSMFKDIPHLMCPVVTETAKAAAILEWAVTKMDERYELLAEAGVRDVTGYNSLGWNELKQRMNPSTEAEEARIPKKLPYLVFIVDELADLIITSKDVEGLIVRLAQKSRAVGMHLILATQRPQANVVTGLIKSNMPCRISFKVSSGMDSRIVLDQKGAELLLGQGDMLFLSPRSSKLRRAQGTLVEDPEIRRTVKFLKTIAQQNFEPQLVQLKSPGLGGDDQERDPLFDEAVNVVLQSKRGSVSLLQRRLTIGYGRASRLIEQMAEAGIIGEYKGSQAREVNITLDEWDAIRAQAQADAELADDTDETDPDTQDNDKQVDDPEDDVDEAEYEEEKD